MKHTLTLVALLLAWCITALDAHSQSYVEISPGYYMAGIPTAEFVDFAAPEAAGRQRQANWCWAATVQMVLNYHGLRVTQEEIVQRIFGAQIDAPGQPAHILAALSGWAPDNRNRYSAISASPVVWTGSQIVQDLAYKWPLIVGLQSEPIGHAYVLTAVYYRVNPYNNEPIFDRVVLRDPWPDSPSRQEMSWDEFQRRLTFVARVRVQRM